MTQPTTEEQARDDMASLIVNIEDFPSETLAQYARQVSLSLSKFSPNEISKLIECLCARLQSDGAKGEEAPDVAEFKSRLLSRLPGVQPSRDELFAFIDALASRPTTPEAQLAEEDGRDLSGETYLGLRVAAWREESRHGEKYGHVYSEHWSTPGAGAKNVERLFTESQVAVLTAQLAAQSAVDGYALASRPTTPEAQVAEGKAEPLGSNGSPQRGGEMEDVQFGVLGAS
jgi:hypothetical protein